MIFTRIIIGLLFIVAGYYITAKSEWIMENFGRVEWFETHLGGDGGSRTFYKLLGVVVIILSFMYITGFLQALFDKIFHPVIGTL